MAGKKPKAGDPFRLDGVKHTIVAIKKNIVGVEQVDMTPDNPKQVPHDRISCAAADVRWDEEWGYWTLPGRENARTGRSSVTATVEE